VTTLRSVACRVITALALFVATAATQAGEAQQRTVVGPSGTEIPYAVYAAEGTELFIWLPSEAGLLDSEESSAERIAQTGIEVWLVDSFSAHFLPIAESSLAQVPATDVVTLLGEAVVRGKEHVFLVSGGRGVVPLLRGAHAWQSQTGTTTPIAGAILLSAKFFVETPDPGTPARLYPVVEATNIPVFLLQPAQSPWRWKLGQTVPALERSGSDVFVWVLRGVRDRFYFRPDAVTYEQELGLELPRLVLQAARLLGTLPSTRRQAGSLTAAEPAVPVGKKERALKPYQGEPKAPALALDDLGGQPRTLAEFRGRVVLVNFWASWCPPCVHEMPSMQRLKSKLADQPFTILAVNMAEDAPTVQRFLDTKVNVDFPIVLDSDGATLKRWQVFAFPTSYVLDKQGNIRYALFGAVDWDAPEIVDVITPLLDE